MRSAIALIVVSIAIYGCGKREGQLELEPLARGLAEAWQPVSRDMKLDIRPEADGNHLTLHCVLRNLSASEIDVDAESLPWNNADAFSVSTVAADGKVTQQNLLPIPPAISRISAPHAPASFASGESMEGRIDMSLLHREYPA